MQTMSVLFVLLLLPFLGGCSHGPEIRRLADENKHLRAELEHVKLWLERYRSYFERDGGQVGVVIDSRGASSGTVVEIQFDSDDVVVKKGARFHILRGYDFVGLVTITEINKLHALGSLDVAFSMADASPMKGDQVWPEG